MQFKDVAINTLVFMDEMSKSGKKQQEYFQPLSEMGIKTVEVRREMFTSPLEEAEDVRNMAETFGITLFYSIPLPMYKNGELDKENLQPVAEEARAMGAIRAKFVIGDYKEVTKEDLEWLETVYHNSGITLSLENDQTEQNGRAEKMVSFLNSCKALGAKGIDHTFDIGNWIYVGEDPEENAHKLKEYTGYIHLKDVKKLDIPITSLINTGDIDWKKVIGILRENRQQVALEYPCGESPIETVKSEVAILIKGI